MLDLRLDRYPLALLFVAVTAGCPGSTQVASSLPSQELVTTGVLDYVAPPDAPQHRHVMNEHGVERVDPYYWMRDDDREDPEVLAYLEAENAYTEVMMGHTEALQETLYDEMLSRLQETDLSVPYFHGGFWYYERTEEGSDYPIYCRREGNMEAPEEVLLDQNELAGDAEYFDIESIEMSPDHDMLAYSVDTTGNEDYTVFIVDLDTGETLPESIPETSYTMAWAGDGQHLFYTTRDAALRPYRLYRYRLGTDPSEAELVYEETDERFWLMVEESRDRQYVEIFLESAVTSEWWIADATDPEAEFRVVAERQDGVLYRISHHGDRFFIRVNSESSGESAVNFRLVEAPDADPSPENWVESLPHRPDVLIEGIDTFANHLVVWERAQGLPQLRIRDLSSGDEHLLEFDEPVYSVFPEDNPEFESSSFRFIYESLLTPESVYEYDMATRERRLLKQTEVVGGFDAEDYTQSRIYATAEDGVQVPISLVHDADLVLDGQNPTLLIGYGAYGYSYDPYFSSARVSLLERGFVFGIAHIRGGGDLGRQWYEDGKYLNKRNTFTDFIACAEHLISEGYTSSDRLAVLGGSAGGMLIGAVANMRPDLFAAIVAEVPFVDVMTTMFDETIPLTVSEWEEWGNPNDLEYFEYMLSYSPYENVSAQDYPHTLITAGLNDNRVGYWEPAKWSARLRDLRTDDNLQLLYTNMGAGHMGASGRYGRYEEIAFIYAFIIDRLGGLSELGEVTRGRGQ